MDKSTRICKVCGVEYEYCKTNRPSGVFCYRDVACCEEHGAIYLDRITKSRQTAVDEVVSAATKKSRKSSKKTETTESTEETTEGADASTDKSVDEEAVG